MTFTVPRTRETTLQAEFKGIEKNQWLIPKSKQKK